MSNKHFTYDDGVSIQAGLQQRLKDVQIAKNIGTMLCQPDGQCSYNFNVAVRISINLS